MDRFPTLSVVTITYGHEQYLTQTLDGILMQKYQGEIEIIIANDQSPDDTDDVVKNYLLVKSIPTNFTIKYTKHEKNKGMIPNFVWALQQASGKYIAICEGDDYWSYSLKLQKQVEFLEKNKDHVLSFTNRNILRDNVLEFSSPLFDKISFNKTEIPSIPIPTLTVLFRNLISEIPLKVRKDLIDGSLFLFLSQYGSFHYLNEITAVYRIHDEGMWSGSPAIKNYTRSVDVRLIAWRNLKNIDKVSLSKSLVTWLTWKKNAEINNKRYFSAARSIFLQSYFNFYSWQDGIRRKLQSLKK